MTAFRTSGLFAPTTAFWVALTLLFALQATLSVQFHRAAVSASDRGERAGFPVDDAWIHQVYARNLIEHGRLDYNPGTAEAGQSSFLWGGLAAAVHGAAARIDAPIGAAMRVLGALLWMATALAAALLVRALPVPGAPFGGVVAAALVAFDPGLGYAAASGMEPLLLSTLLLLTARFALAGRPAITGTIAGLATLARPEGVLATGIALAAGFTRDAAGRPARMSRLLGALGPAVLLPLGWVGFCLASTGRPLPNTWYAKRAISGASDTAARLAPATADGLRLLAETIGASPYFDLHVGYLFVAIGGIALVTRCRRWHAVVALAIPPIYCVGIALTRDMPLPDAFYWARYLVPIQPWIHCIMAVGYAATGSVLLDLMRRPSSSARVAEEIERVETDAPPDSTPDHASAPDARPGPPSRLPAAPPAPVVPDPILAVVLFLLLIIPFAPAPGGLRDAVNAFGADVAVVDAMNVAAAEWVRDNTPADAVVAAQDAGAIRYFGERDVIDLIGLNDHRLLDAGRRDGSIGGYLMERRPTHFFLLDPDAGATELRAFALSLGLMEVARFEVDAYTPFHLESPKAISVLGR